MTTAIPEEFVTRVDFATFWNNYFTTGLQTLTDDDLRTAKDALLEEQVPTFTVYAYFQHLARMVANEVGDGRELGMIEQVLSDLEDLAFRNA